VKREAEAGVQVDRSETGAGVIAQGGIGRDVGHYRDMHLLHEDGEILPLFLHLLRSDARELILLMSRQLRSNHLLRELPKPLTTTQRWKMLLNPDWRWVTPHSSKVII
jgi:hypothetical protein